jgi:hypothetical protein
MVMTLFDIPFTAVLSIALITFFTTKLIEIHMRDEGLDFTGFLVHLLKWMFRTACWLVLFATVALLCAWTYIKAGWFGILCFVCGVGYLLTTADWIKEKLMIKRS